MIILNNIGTIALSKSHSDNIENVKKFFNREQIYEQLSIVSKSLINKNAKLILNIGGGSFTDGDSITIGLPSCFIDKSNEEIYAALVALVAHECQHVNSSSFILYRKFQTDISNYLYDNLKISKDIGMKIAKEIGNCVEDGRIERILSFKWEGIAKYLQFLNGTLWHYSPVRGESELEDFFNTICTYACSGVLPKDYNKIYGNDTNLDKNFDKIKNHIMYGIRDFSSKLCFDTCREIIEMVSEYLLELVGAEDDQNNQNNKDSQDQNGKNKDQDNQSGKNGQDNKNDQNNQSNQNNNDNKSNQNGQKENKKFLDSLSSDPEYTTSNEKEKGNDKDENPSHLNNDSNPNSKKKPNNSPIPQNKGNSGENNEKRNEGENSQKKDEDDKIGDQILQVVEDLIEKIKEEVKSKITCEPKEGSKKDINNKNDFTDIVSGYGDVKNFKETRKPFEVYDLDMDIKCQGNYFKREIQNMLRNKEAYTFKNQQKGIVDINGLYRVGLNDYNVFVRKNVPSEIDYVGYILVDNSGSMSTDKRFNAYSSCAIIEEGLKGTIPVKIASFSANSLTVEHSLIKDFNDNNAKNLSWNYFLSSRRGHCNKDGFSIRIATREIANRPEKNKILFILSDGLPSQYNSMEEGKEDVKKAVLEARQKGILVVSVMFGNKDFREKNINEYIYMYEKNVISCDPYEITQNIVNVIKKMIKRG